MLELVFGLALICAGIFAWRCARWAAYVGLGLGYLWLVGAIVFLVPFFPLAVLSIALGHRALWLANPRRRRGNAATMGMGGGGTRRADWIAAAITCLAIGPVAGFLLGVVFGWLVTAFMVIAGLDRHGISLSLLRGLLRRPVDGCRLDARRADRRGDARLEAGLDSDGGLPRRGRRLPVSLPGHDR